MYIDTTRQMKYNMAMSFKNIYHGIWKFAYKFNKRSILSIDEVFTQNNIQYGADEKNNVFDIHYPTDMASKKLPTIFIVHGGGYVAGKKDNLDSYAKTLASKGFCVVNMEYTKCDGPEKKYFLNQIAEVYDLFDYISEDEKIKSHIDFDNIFMSGDSAGAHIISMVTNIQTNPALKDIFNLSGGPQIKGCILISPMFGPYKIGIPVKRQYENIVFGDINETTKEKCYPFDVLSRHFPPSIMLTFKNDFLVKKHQKEFLKKARKLNLSVEHCEVLKGYKIFHDVITKYPDCYPNCIEKISEFVNERVKGNTKTGVNKCIIKEDDLIPNFGDEQPFEQTK